MRALQVFVTSFLHSIYAIDVAILSEKPLHLLSHRRAEQKGFSNVWYFIIEVYAL